LIFATYQPVKFSATCLRIEYVWIPVFGVQIWNWKTSQRITRCKEKIFPSQKERTSGEV